MGLRREGKEEAVSTSLKERLREGIGRERWREGDREREGGKDREVERGRERWKEREVEIGGEREPTNSEAALSYSALLHLSHSSSTATSGSIHLQYESSAHTIYLLRERIYFSPK